MAYVCLGRCEELKDIYILGDFDVKGIHCHPDALTETIRLEKMFDDNLVKLDENRQQHWKISYLNVRALLGHQWDVRCDNYVLDSDIFCLAETHIEPGVEIKFGGFKEHLLSFGQGKGIAAFTKMDILSKPNFDQTEKSSAMLIKTDTFDIIFLYLSKQFDEAHLLSVLENWLESKMPTVVMGDVNWDFRNNSGMKKFMQRKNFKQLIDRPTFLQGTLIDHVYVNSEMIELNVHTEQNAAYYSDHDIITLFIPKSGFKKKDFRGENHEQIESNDVCFTGNVPPTHVPYSTLNKQTVNDKSHSMNNQKFPKKAAKRKSMKRNDFFNNKKKINDSNQISQVGHIEESQKLNLVEGEVFASLRLQQLGMIVSPTQPDTPGDGNCFIHAILDQLKYDNLLKDMKYDVINFRKEVVHSLVDHIINGNHEWFADPEEGSPEKWMEKYEKDEVVIDNYFIYLCALKIRRRIILYPVFESEVFTLFEV